MSQTQTYQVRGMTCEHCAGAVTSELQALDTVTRVTIAFVPQGDSIINVRSSAVLDTEAIRNAIARAGYELVGTPAG